jgi:acyl-coenzyme A synthetase/AMP-(fatty) acid ligase
MDIDYKDIVANTSDIGWVVGHTFIVYGPLLRGATTIIFEGKPVGTPHCGKIWEIIEKYKVKAFYSSPTALRAIKREDSDHVTMRSMIYLPLNPSQWQVKDVIPIPLYGFKKALEGISLLTTNGGRLNRAGRSAVIT